MNGLLFTGGILAIGIGLIHSVLGELLIFKRLRNGTVIPTAGEPLLRERNVRILWATWHVVTIFGWAFGAILLQYSFASSDPDFSDAILQFIAYSMLASAVLVLVATKGRHPGWVGLLGVAVLCWFG